MPQKQNHHHSFHATEEVERIILERSKNHASINAYLEACIRLECTQAGICDACADRRIAVKAKEVIGEIVAQLRSEL